MVQWFQHNNPRAKGALFEQKARSFLEQQGLSFVAQNQVFKVGELDLIMKEHTTFVFVEVRRRKNSNFGTALESINYNKQQKWLKAANLWLTKQNKSLDTADCRFDAVVFEGTDEPIWIKNFLG